MRKINLAILLFLLIPATICSQEEDTLRSNRSPVIRPDTSLSPKEVKSQKELLNTALPNPLDFSSGNRYRINKERVTTGWNTKKKTIQNSSYSPFIIPVALISYGVINCIDGGEDKEIKDKVDVRQGIRLRHLSGPTFFSGSIIRHRSGSLSRGTRPLQEL